MLGAAEGHWGGKRTSAPYKISEGIPSDLGLASEIAQPEVQISALPFDCSQAFSSLGTPLLSHAFRAFNPGFCYTPNTQLTSAPTRVTKITVPLVVLFNMLLC